MADSSSGRTGEQQRWLGLFEQISVVLRCDVMVKQFVGCLIALQAMVHLPSAIAQTSSVRPGVSTAVAEERGSSLPHPDGDVSELRDTFWHPKQLQGSTTNVAGVVVRVQIFTPDGSNASITFSISGKQ